MTGWIVERADPGEAGPLALLRAHLDLMHAVTPPGSVHALDLDALRGPGLRFLALRERHGDGPARTIGIGALKVGVPGPASGEPAHGEIKSMHTREADRGRGVARAMLRHLLDEARAAGLARVSLETGSSDHFAAPRALYAAHGFVACGPFGAYAPDPHSHFMTRAL